VETVGCEEGLLQEEAPIIGFVVNDYGLYRSKPSWSASSNYWFGPPGVHSPLFTFHLQSSAQYAQQGLIGILCPISECSNSHDLLLRRSAPWTNGSCRATWRRKKLRCCWLGNTNICSQLVLRETRIFRAFRNRYAFQIFVDGQECKHIPVILLAGRA
jgi:hypothetical protein